MAGDPAENGKRRFKQLAGGAAQGETVDRALILLNGYLHAHSSRMLALLLELDVAASSRCFTQLAVSAVHQACQSFEGLAHQHPSAFSQTQSRNEVGRIRCPSGASILHASSGLTTILSILRVALNATGRRQI